MTNVGIFSMAVGCANVTLCFLTSTELLIYTAKKSNRKRCNKLKLVSKDFLVDERVAKATPRQLKKSFASNLVICYIAYNLIFWWYKLKVGRCEDEVCAFGG